MHGQIVTEKGSEEKKFDYNFSLFYCF